jgi:hypothetical protein
MNNKLPLQNGIPKFAHAVYSAMAIADRDDSTAAYIAYVPPLKETGRSLPPESVAEVGKLEHIDFVLAAELEEGRMESAEFDELLEALLG